MTNKTTCSKCLDSGRVLDCRGNDDPCPWCKAGIANDLAMQDEERGDCARTGAMAEIHRLTWTLYEESLTNEALSKRTELLEEDLQTVREQLASLKVSASKLCNAWRGGCPGREHYIDEDMVSDVEKAIQAANDGNFVRQLKYETLSYAAASIAPISKEAADKLNAQAEQIQKEEK